ncbi:MAG: MtrB/PioB family outer membrane beta-barrel protein [Acidobacteria bacterium]|nr:MtrB/PioB family outer membrane beta-barrel protein [Acidobacteriota bacterium]
MRTRLMIATALLLASAGLAMAQPQPDATATAPALTGSIDLGFRASSTDGDRARFERFRDLRDGAVSRITLGKDTDAYTFTLKMDNIGYHDQRYQVNYNNSGRVRFTAQWDSTPLNYGYNTSSPWVEQSPGVFTLDPATRLLVQNNAPGVVGIPTTAAQLLTASIYRGLAKPFDIQARRDTAGFNFWYAATRDLNFNVAFNSTTKTGHEVKGASFAFNVADQLPVPLDNRTNDLTTAAEWMNDQGMIRVAWDGSWFTNNIHEILFDNPVRATDTFPIDSSGYSNGRGAARSRMAAPPSNSLNTVSAMGLYKMPGHSNVNAQLSLTTMKQNDDLIPWTSNQVIASPAVYKNFPGLAQLPRNSAEAEVKGVNALLNYTTRPNRYFGLNMRYRYNDHQNRTPIFDATEYVRLDAVPEETGAETEHFNIKQNTLDLNATFNLIPYTAFRVGYTLDDVKRTGRAFSDSTDYTFRTTLDTVANKYVMLRVIYENTQRIGTGFSEQSLEDGGFQPGLRTYDEADRDRNRGWLVFTVTPTPMVDFTLSLAAGRDRYRGEGHEFGLLDNDNTVVNAGVNVSPIDGVRFGANYGRDQYTSNQSARNANPPGTDYGSWFDPNRTWSLNGDERVNNATVYVDLFKAIPNTDIQVSYDFSDSNNSYIHSGPRIQELSTNKALSGASAIRYPGFTIPSPCAAGLTSCFEPLPAITNTWHRFTIDLKYMFATKVGVGVGYWYEKFDVSDYATIDLPGQPGTPRIDYLGEIGTGYGNRPYKGSTASVRLLYLF